MGLEVVGRGDEPHQVRHPVPRGAGAEPLPRRQRVEGGHAAGAATADGHPVRVDVAPRREVQRRIEAVLRVGDAPLAPQGAAVGAPVPAAAGVVDARHGEAACREELQGQVEPGLARRRRASVAPGHQRWRRRHPAPWFGRGPAGTACRAPARPERPVSEKGSPVATSACPRAVSRAAGARGRAGPSGVHTQTFGGASARAADQRQPLPCAQTAPIDTHGCSSGCGGVVHRPVRGQPDERVAPGRRHAGDDGAIGQLGHRRLTEDPVRPVELGRGNGERRRLHLFAGQPRVDVGLPPASPVRDEAQRAVAAPGRLADRLLGTARHPPGRAGRLERIGTGCGAGTADERQHDDGRGVPRHVGVVPDDHGQAVAGRIDPGGPEEVVPLEQRGLVRRRPLVESATMLRVGLPTPSGWTSRTARTQSPSGVALEPAVVVHLPFRWLARVKGSGVARPAGPSQNHTRWSACST